MIRTLEVEALGLPAFVLPASDPNPGCARCAAYHPDPQLSGNLQVDPEIHLPSLGMDVDIAYFYNAAVNGSKNLQLKPRHSST